MHSHSHHHHSSTSNLKLAFFLNLSFTIIEFIGGILTNSTAIMADAVHDLGDTLAIGLAWLLGDLGNKSANNQFTYGYKRLSLLGALINGIILIVGSAWILWISIPRLLSPEMPDAQGMLWLAILGVTVNGYAAYKLSGGKTLNERVLNWHLIEDVLGWVAVLIVSIVLMFFDWPILDPILSIAFTLFILFNVAKNFSTTIKIFLQSVPDQQLHEDVRKKLLALKHIKEIHHLHLWSLDGEHHVLTAHLVLDKPLEFEIQKQIKADIKTQLAEFQLAHTTFEFEQLYEECRDSS